MVATATKRLSQKAAADLLGVSVRTVQRLRSAGEFTTIKRGMRSEDAINNSRVFLLLDEVEIYGSDGLEALRHYRAKKKRNKK